MPLLESFRTRAITAAAVLTCLPTAHGAEIQTDSDLKIRWDNTFKYSTAYRLKDPSLRLTSDPNLDDGDASFRRGVISNRIDLLSELDVGYRDGGLRMSAAGWYDSVYNRRSDYNGAFPNAISVPSGDFTSATRGIHGRNLELLDAFVFGKTALGGSTLTTRLGRHSLIYGETLFFGANGIAAAQGPVDVVKLLSVPGTQFKEVLRPTEQISTNLQLKPNLSIGGYYQFKWNGSRLPAPGSYFSSVDFAPNGAESIYLGPGVGVRRGADLKPRNSGQGGLQVRYTPTDSGVDLGFYLARYHEKAPSGLYIVPPGLPTAGPSIVQAYHEGVRTAGVSASTSVGEWNVAGEFSVRRNMPLNSNPVLTFGVGNSVGNPLYAVGNTAHANLSGIYVLPRTSLWDGGNLLVEFAWHRLTGISSNPVSPLTNSSSLDPGVTRDASALRFIFEPVFYQAMDGLDISMPIGLGYGLSGRSPLAAGATLPSRGNGDFSIGIQGTYAQVWQFGINAVTYLGRENLMAVSGVQTYGQTLKDRSFISFNIKRTF